MPKIKNKIIKKENSYFDLAIGVFILLITILILGRVGQIKYLSLLISIIFGDYSSIVLIIIFIYALFNLIFKKHIDFHHIYFIGFIFIYFSLSMLSHLNLYDNMTDTNIITFSFNLYSRYFISYDYSYSTGGGVIGTLFTFFSSVIAGRMGVILLSISFFIIGVSYLFNIKILKIFKRRGLKNNIKALITKVNDYFSNINYPKKTEKIISESILKDEEKETTFTLQEEINKEVLLELKKYIMDNKLYCVCDSFITSYTSSRFIVKLANKNDNIILELKHFFNRKCFIIKNENTIYFETPNSFKKLLALKSILPYSLKNSIALAIDIANEPICINLEEGKLLTIIGDYTSGVKTCIRGLLTSLIIKGFKCDNIYLVDLFKEYSQAKCLNYIDNESRLLDMLDEVFNEYERRISTLRYLECDSVNEANKKIKQIDTSLKTMDNMIFILSLNPKDLSDMVYSKISYLIKFGLKVNMSIVLVLRDKDILSRININNSDILSFYLNDVSLSIKLFGSDVASRLQKKGDLIMQSNSRIYHGQAPYISLEDFENVCKNI